MFLNIKRDISLKLVKKKMKNAGLLLIGMSSATSDSRKFIFSLAP